MILDFEESSRLYKELSKVAIPPLLRLPKIEANSPEAGYSEGVRYFTAMDRSGEGDNHKGNRNKRLEVSHYHKDRNCEP